MTPAKFMNLAALIRIRPGKSRSAAYLVIVQGMTVSEAAAYQCITRQAVNQAVLRFRRGLAKINEVANGPD